MTPHIILSYRELHLCVHLYFLGYERDWNSCCVLSVCVWVVWMVVQCGWTHYCSLPSQTPALGHSCSVVPLTAIYLSLCAAKTHRTTCIPEIMQTFFFWTFFASPDIFKACTVCVLVKIALRKGKPLLEVPLCGFHHRYYDFKGTVHL